MPDLLGSTLGPYRILEQIGLGGMATVYKAYQPGMDRLVALKVLPHHYARDPRFVKRFEQEARVIAKLEHRNIVPVYDFGEQDGTAYLAMRYLQAGTVKEILSHGPLPLGDAAKLLGDVAAALDYAHSQGIIHRFVKPSNVLVDKQGNAYLTDFGIAKVIESTMEMTGSAALGTPAYMAPEQTLGKAVTPQSDVYSLGVMLYEMVTGKPPFEADTPMAIALMHVHEPLTLPRKVKPDLPEAVELVILKALAKEPKDRFQSAGEAAKAFAEAVGGDTRVAPTRLIELASVAATGKGGEEVTYDIREEIRKRERTERTRRVMRWSPWIVSGLVIAGLAVGLFLSRSETAQVRSASAQTATAIANLFEQLAIAQTAVAGGGGAQYEPTVQYLQTQMAAAGVSGGAETAEPTLTSTATASPTLVDSSGQIAFISDREGGSQIFVMNSDGSDAKQLTNTDGLKGDPAWSPDGHKIAFTWVDNIYVMNADGSNVNLLTTPLDSASLYGYGKHAWSPDGLQIVFTLGCDAPCVSGIYITNVDGSRTSQLLSLAAWSNLAWYPDGQRLIFTRWSGEVYSMNIDGSNQYQLENVPYWIGQLALSPDGEKIVYKSRYELYMINTDGTGQTQLTFGGGNSSPSWSPDGRKIAFCSNGEVYVVNADGSEPINLTNNPADDCYAGLAWGGNRMALSTSTPTPFGAPTATPIPSRTPTLGPSPTTTPVVTYVKFTTQGCSPNRVTTGTVVLEFGVALWSSPDEARAAMGDSWPTLTANGQSASRRYRTDPLEYEGKWGFAAYMQFDPFPGVYEIAGEWFGQSRSCTLTVINP